MMSGELIEVNVAGKSRKQRERERERERENDNMVSVLAVSAY